MRSGLNQNVSQEQTLETLLARLDQIGEQVTGIGDQVSDINESGKLLKMNLLGGYEAETEHGRIPKLEVIVVKMDTRLAKLEEAYVRNGAYGTVIGLVSGFAGSLFTGGLLLLLRFLLEGGKF